MENNDGKFCPHTIDISISEYDKIKERLRWLDALESVGVDNWEGIDQARKIYRGINDE